MWGTDLEAQGVFHLQNTANSSSGVASTDGTVNGATPTDAKIHRGYSFDGNDYISCPSTPFQISGNLTISAWVKRTAEHASYGVIVGKRSSTNVSYILGILSSEAPFMQVEAAEVDGTVPLPLNEWSYVVGVYDRTQGFIRLYVNGVAETPVAKSDAIQTDGNNLGIGAYYGSSWQNYSSAVIDEVKIYSDAKSADWVATEYANQAYPASFAACSVEENITKLYRFPITIDRTKVTGTNTNFPYLFSELCPSIPVGFWSHVTDTNGADIRFYDTNHTELKREIVAYDS
jgi:hypothetical protein